jgi:hypothetical protein
MYFKPTLSIFVVFCLINSFISAPVEKESEEVKEDIQLLDGYQNKNEDLSEFK